MEITVIRILVVLMACIDIYMLIECYQFHKLICNYVKKHNHVKFYVARDNRTHKLYLYLGKPFRGISTFYTCKKGGIIAKEEYFSHFGLNKKDFENLEFEDEPVEVFLNL